MVDTSCTTELDGKRCGEIRAYSVFAKSLTSAAESHPDALTPDMRMRAGDVIGLGPFGKKVDPTTEISSMPAEHAFHMMLQTCTSCHARFRVKTN